MKKLTLIILALGLSLVLTQCSKTGVTPEDETLTLEQTLTQVTAEAVAIDEADALALEDSTALPLALERALDHLDRLLTRAQAVVDTAGNLTADSLMADAWAAQTLALDAAATDSLRLAFAHVRESRHLALEALRAVQGETEPPLWLEHLWNDRDLAAAMAEHLHHRLQDQPDPLAHRLAQRGNLHLRLAREALEAGQPRRAHFHLHQAMDFYRLALERLDAQP